MCGLLHKLVSVEWSTSRAMLTSGVAGSKSAGHPRPQFQSCARTPDFSHAGSAHGRPGTRDLRWPLTKSVQVDERKLKRQPEIASGEPCRAEVPGSALVLRIQPEPQRRRQRDRRHRRCRAPAGKQRTSGGDLIYMPMTFRSPAETGAIEFSRARARNALETRRPLVVKPPEADKPSTE